MDFIFSTNKNALNINDQKKAVSLIENYFKTEQDSSQIPINEENITWINKNIPECVNVIKKDNNIIGLTFIIPCNIELMNKFVEKNINEKQMFELIKKYVNYSNFETIYLCSAFILPEFRRKSLAFEGMIRSLNLMLKKAEQKSACFSGVIQNKEKHLLRKYQNIFVLI